MIEGRIARFVYIRYTVCTTDSAAWILLKTGLMMLVGSINRAHSSAPETVTLSLRSPAPLAPASASPSPCFELSESFSLLPHPAFFIPHSDWLCSHTGCKIVTNSNEGGEPL